MQAENPTQYSDNRPLGRPIPSEFYPGVVDRFLRGCIIRRMPRMQVYLPEELYEQVKAHRLPASELLQDAVRAELRRLRLLAETDRYLKELVGEVGPPTRAQAARARLVAQRLAHRPTRKAG